MTVAIVVTQALPHRSLAASAAPSSPNATVLDPSAVAMTSNASVAELVAPNITISGLVSTALLDDADYVAAPVPVVSTAILNISANNASASVLLSQSDLSCLDMLCDLVDV